MQINLAPDLSLFAIMVIFILNYLIVRKFFLQPVNAILEERDRETRSAETLYEDALARFAEATAQTESQLQSARRDAAQVRDRFRGEAAAYRQQVVERTQGEARDIVADADVKLTGDVKVARESIVRDSESLAKEAAQRILGRAV